MKPWQAVKSFFLSFERRELAWFGILSIAALAARFGFAPLKGNEYDMGAFSNWASGARPFAFFGFYSFFDHPHLSFPNYALYFPVLALMGPIAQVATVSGRVLLKTPAIIGDVFLAGIVFCAAKPRWRLPAAAFVLFNPAVWYVSAIFGQTDSLHAAFMALAALFAAKNKYRGAWLMLAIAVFFKIQAVAILPLIFALNFKASGFKKMIVDLLPAAVVAGLMSLPYMIVSSPAIIWRSFQGTFSMYPQVTFNAWNPWYLLCMAYGHWISDAATVFGISYKTIGVGAFILAAVAIAVALPKRPERSLFFAAAAAMCLAFFMLPTEMHERYAYPFIPMIAVVLGEAPFVAAAGVVVSLAIFFDINFVQPMPIWNVSFVHTVRGCTAWSAVFVAAFIAYLVWYFRRAAFAKRGERDRLMAE